MRIHYGDVIAKEKIIEFNKLLLLILKGATLIYNTQTNLAIISKSNKSKDIELSAEMSLHLALDNRVYLDSSNFDFQENFYERTSDWREDINFLKKEYPHIFREEKILKLLKS